MIKSEIRSRHLFQSNFISFSVLYFLRITAFIVMRFFSHTNMRKVGL